MVSSEEARRVTDWRREKERWETVELKDRQQ